MRCLWAFQATFLLQDFRHAIFNDCKIFPWLYANFNLGQQLVSICAPNEPIILVLVTATFSEQFSVKHHNIVFVFPVIATQVLFQLLHAFAFYVLVHEIQIFFIQTQYREFLLFLESYVVLKHVAVDTDARNGFVEETRAGRLLGYYLALVKLETLC